MSVKNKICPITDFLGQTLRANDLIVTRSGKKGCVKYYPKGKIKSKGKWFILYPHNKTLSLHKEVLHSYIVKKHRSMFHKNNTIE